MNTKNLLALTAALTLSGALIAPSALAHECKKDDRKAKAARINPARYGGPSYGGVPALAVTASLVEAGGGAQNFSIATALVSMVGEELVNAEVAKLTAQYGETAVKQWIEIFDFAVKDALRIATEAGVTLPKAALSGKKLASTLVMAGLDKENVFHVEFMLDKAVTNGIHHKVMENIDARYSGELDALYHRITNQAMYDLAQALGAKKVKLSPFH